MADYDSGLPIRSEADGLDERVQTKLVDKDNPDTQQVIVDTDSNLHTESHGNDPAGLDTVLRTSEQGSASVDGVYDGTNNTDPSQVGLVGMSRNASPADSQQILRLTAITNGVGDVRALDVGIRDESGEPFTQDNPLPVAFSESEGDEIHEFKEATSIAKDATDEHTYSVADGRTLLLYGILASGSGKIKVELQIGDGAASETFTTKAVTFNSTSNPQADIDLQRVPIKVVGTTDTTTVKVIVTNRDNQAQDLHSTIMGVERNT